MEIIPQLFVTNVSQCAEDNQTFCTRNDDYPIEYMNSVLQLYLDQYESIFDEFSSEMTIIFGSGLPHPEIEVDLTDDAMTRPRTQPSTTPHMLVPHGATKAPTPVAPRKGIQTTTISPTQTPAVEDSSRAFSANDYIPRVAEEDDEDEEDIQLCGAVDKVIYPTSATSEAGVGLFIFNSDDHKQGVHVSICQDVGKPCDDLVVLRNNYRSICKQQKVYRELLSLSPQGTPIKERFEFPASCSCVLRRIKQSN